MTEPTTSDHSTPDHSTDLQAAIGPFNTRPTRRIDDAGVVPGARGPNLGHLLAAVGNARVDLGEYDARMLKWLADWDAPTVRVVAGWIARAHLAGIERGIDRCSAAAAMIAGLSDVDDELVPGTAAARDGALPALVDDLTALVDELQRRWSTR